MLALAITLPRTIFEDPDPTPPHQVWLDHCGHGIGYPCRDDGGGGKVTGMHESQFAVVSLPCAVIGQEHGELGADFTGLGRH